MNPCPFVAVAREETVLAEAGLLTTADFVSAEGMAVHRRRQRLAAVALLRQLVAAVDLGAARAPILRDRRGRPSIADGPGVSYSHGDGWVAAAVAHGVTGVGIDVQVPRRATPAMVRRACPEDADDLLALPHERRLAEFGAIWAVKEACGKAVGRGLPMPPTWPRVRPFQAGGAAPEDRLTWTVLCTAGADHPAVAIAVIPDESAAYAAAATASRH